MYWNKGSHAAPHFHAFQPVSTTTNEKGFLELEDRLKLVEIKTKKVRQDIEAILGRSYPLPGMKANPLFGATGVKKWMQMSREEVRAYRDEWDLKPGNGTRPNRSK
jgi:hypothetical protein